MAETRLCLEKVAHALGTGMPMPAPGHSAARPRPQAAPSSLAQQRWSLESPALGVAPNREAEPPRGLPSLRGPSRDTASGLPVSDTPAEPGLRRHGLPQETCGLAPRPQLPQAGPGGRPGRGFRAQQFVTCFGCADELKGGINFLPQLATADLSFSVFVTDTARLL